MYQPKKEELRATRRAIIQAQSDKLRRAVFARKSPDTVAEIRMRLEAEIKKLLEEQTEELVEETVMLWRDTAFEFGDIVNLVYPSLVPFVTYHDLEENEPEAPPGDRGAGGGDACRAGDGMNVQTEAKRAAKLMLKTMNDSDAAYEPFERILEAAGALPLYPPMDPDAPHDAEAEKADQVLFAKRSAMVNAMFDRVSAHLLKSGSLAEAIAQALPDQTAKGDPS